MYSVATWSGIQLKIPSLRVLYDLMRMKTEKFSLISDVTFHQNILFYKYI